MIGAGIQNPEIVDQAMVGRFAFAALAADLERLVERMEIDFAQGFLSAGAANEVTELLRRAEALDRTPVLGA